MKRLHEPNREGGYPVTGEALEILGVDMPTYINAILEQITPDNSVVFLSDSYAYVKLNGYKEIMACTLTGRTQAQLMAGAKSQSAVTETNYSDTVSGTTYSNTRRSRTIEISSSTLVQLGAPVFYNLESLLNRKLFNEVDYFSDLRITASSSIENLATTGRAILKGGVAYIDLCFTFVGDGAITVNLPDAFNCIAIVTSASHIISDSSSDRYYPLAKIEGTTLTLYILATTTEGGYATVHFQYIPDEITPL